VPLVVDGIYLRYRRSVSQAARKGVLLVAVGVREGGGFDVLDWRGAFAETTEDYEELLTQLWRRGLESVELIVSDGLPAVVSAGADGVSSGAASAVPGALVPPSGGLDARFPWFQRRKFRREFWWIWMRRTKCKRASGPGDFVPAGAARLRRWSRSFRRNGHQVLAFFAFPAPWRHRLRTTKSGRGWFKHLRRYLSRFPGCRNAEHSEQVLGCFLLAAEQNAPLRSPMTEAP